MGDKQEVDAQELVEVGERLSRLPSSKDLLCKLLKQALMLLNTMSQSIDVNLELALRPLKVALVQSNLIKHKDKDVRLLVTACISEIMRIVAPEAPYDDETLKDVFELIVASFKGLSETSSPHFERRVNILEAVASYRSCVVMLDIDCHDLIYEMFQIFFATVGEEPKFVMTYMKTIMCVVLEESEEIPDRLLELLLGHLMRGKKGVSKAGNALARDVVEKCAETLGPYVDAFLSSIMSEGKPTSRWLESYHDLIFEIYTCAPSLLASSISKLTDELLTDEIDVRLKAVKLLGRMFASQQGVSVLFEQLFAEYLKRFTDKAVEVRLAMVACAKQCLLASPSSPRARDFLSVLSDRLQDYDDGVRRHVVLAICDFAESNSDVALVDELKRVAERLRDTEAIVRSETLKRLTDLYRSFCSKKVETLPVNTESFYWIPSKLIRCCFYGDSKEFRAQNMELVFSEQLFPSGFPVQERVKCWIAFFSAFDSNDVKALEKILQQKQRLHFEMQNLFSLRQKLKEDESQEGEQRLLALCKSMANFFADPPNAEIQLNKLLQLKDSKLQRDLGTLLDSNISLAQSLSIRTSLLNRLGEKHPQYEFLKVLAVKCSYVLFGKEHIHSLFAELKEFKGLEDEHQLRACMGLLVAFANHFPTLLDGVEGDVMELLKEDKDFLKEGAVEVLAKVGGSMRGRFTEESNSIDLLEKLCIDGNRKQAKYAVQALAAMSNDFGSKVFSGLYRKLLDLLESDVKLPTILQSLGCIAQHAVSIFEKHEEDLVNFLVRDLFTKADLQVSSDGDDTEHPSAGATTQLKIFGLKTLVRSFLPNKDSHQVQRSKGLLGILLKFLELGEIRDDVESSEVNKAHLRLAAAKGVLRLSRRYDAQISEQLFRATVLCAKDPLSFVRRQFVGKVHKLLKERYVPQKYACALAISIGINDDEFLTDAKHQLCDFVESSRRQARLRESLGAGSSDPPENVLFYLVHILAQEAEFPKTSEGSLSLEDIEPYFRQLYVFLWALVNHDRSRVPIDEIRNVELDKVSVIFGVLCAMKDTEDALDASKTENTYILSEIGITIAKKLVKVDEISSLNIPTILPPTPIYKSFDGTTKGNQKLEKSYVSALLTDDETFSKMLPCLDGVVGHQMGKADHVENGSLDQDERHPTKRKGVSELLEEEERPVQKRSKVTEFSGKGAEVANKVIKMSGREDDKHIYNEKPIQKRKRIADISAMEEKPVPKRNKVTELAKINEQQKGKVSPKLSGASERRQALGQMGSPKEKGANLELDKKSEKLDTKATLPKQTREQHLLEEEDEDETLSSALQKCGKRKRINKADEDVRKEVSLSKFSGAFQDNGAAVFEATGRHETKTIASQAGVSQNAQVSAFGAVGSPTREALASEAVVSPDTGGAAHNAEGSGRRHVRISIKKPKPPSEAANRYVKEKDDDMVQQGRGNKVFDGKQKGKAGDGEADVQGTKSSRGGHGKSDVTGSKSPKSRMKKKGQVHGEELLHLQVRVWWPLDKRFYQGTITSYNAEKGTHTVTYDDGDVEILKMEKERWKLAKEEDTPEPLVTPGMSNYGSHIKTKETHDSKKISNKKPTKSSSSGVSGSARKVKPHTSTPAFKLSKAEVSRGPKADGYKEKSTPVVKHQSKTLEHDEKKATSLPNGQDPKSTSPKSDENEREGSPFSATSKDSDDSDDVLLSTWTSAKKKGR